MTVIENHCRDCAVPGYPCLGDYCPRTRVEVHYCDKCGTELDHYSRAVGGKELCESCYEELYTDNTNA